MEPDLIACGDWGSLEIRWEINDEGFFGAVIDIAPVKIGEEANRQINLFCSEGVFDNLGALLFLLAPKSSHNQGAQEGDR